MGLSLELLQSPDGGELVRGLAKWREVLTGFLSFVLLSASGVQKDRLPLSTMPVVVPFNGKGQPSRILVFSVRATAPVSWAWLPAQKGDKGPRLVASGDCTVDVWMVP